MTCADDVVAAWRFYRMLRAWRVGALAGHVWVRVGVHPGQPSTVRPTWYVAHARRRTMPQIEGAGL